MTVTGITEISKSRFRIYIDNEFAFVLYKGELHIYDIKMEEEIANEAYIKIMEEVLPKRAKLRAMNLLKSRSYTRKQLYDKLNAGGYSEEIIQIALSYVESYGYINDIQYANDFIEYNKENKSKTKITNDLIKKGISKEIIEEAYQENVGEDKENLEKEQILEWVRKKNFRASEATFEEKQKFGAFLYRKGFQIESIRSVLSLDITSIYV